MDLHKIDWENMPWEPVREGIERKAFSGAGATVALHKLMPKHEPKPHKHTYEQSSTSSPGHIRFHVGDKSVVLGPGGLAADPAGRHALGRSGRRRAGAQSRCFHAGAGGICAGAAGGTLARSCFGSLRVESSRAAHSLSLPPWWGGGSRGGIRARSGWGVVLRKFLTNNPPPALARLSPPHSPALRAGRQATRTRMPLHRPRTLPTKGEGERVCRAPLIQSTASNRRRHDLVTAGVSVDTGAGNCRGSVAPWLTGCLIASRA